MPQQWPEVRRSFYEQFTTGLSHPSELVGSPPRVCWSDFGGTFQHIWLYPFLSPTPSRPELPWVARVAVNILDPMRLPTGIERRLCINSWHPDWHLELTVLPEELTGFAPWLAHLADAHDELWSERVLETPYRLHRQLSRDGMLEAASLWTATALRCYDEFCTHEDQRQRQLRRRFELQVALAELQSCDPQARRLLQTG